MDMVIIKRIKHLLNKIKEDRNEVLVTDAINEIKQPKYKYSILCKQSNKIVYSCNYLFPDKNLALKAADFYFKINLNSEYDKYKVLYYRVDIDNDFKPIHEIVCVDEEKI